MGPPDPDAEYRVTRVDDPEWLRSRFRSEGLENGDVIVRGQCRRCGHEVDNRVTRETIRAFQQSPASEPMAMKCNCGAEHAGRESGQGCGAWWGFKLRARP